MHKGQCECEFECERLGKPLASLFGALQVTRYQQFTTQILSVKRGTYTPVLRINFSYIQFDKGYIFLVYTFNPFEFCYLLQSMTCNYWCNLS